MRKARYVEYWLGVGSIAVLLAAVFLGLSVQALSMVETATDMDTGLRLLRSAQSDKLKEAKRLEAEADRLYREGRYDDAILI